MAGQMRVAIFAASMVSASGRLSWLQQAVKFDLFKAGVHPWGLPCLNPVKRAPVKFPKELLLGVPSEPVMYSGYINVTDRDYLFYWFAEAEGPSSKDTPLIVWSNGGPGCSAMEGFTTEHGPLVLHNVKTDPEGFTDRLTRNRYAWNKRAHVLYVDQPRYVGYSCGTGPFVTSSVDAGKDMVAFLRGWRQLFPEHAHRGLIFATESYGGHYAPAWYSAMSDHNLAEKDKMKVIGILIGNGIVNETVQALSFPEFARREGLVPDNATALERERTREAVTKHLGYMPNYYDYRLEEKECCGCSSYNYKPWANWLLRKDVMKALNVCGNAGNKAFGNCAAGCISLPEFDKDDSFDYSGALGKALADGVKVTLYYGMQDTACNYVGGYAMANLLDWPGAQAWRDAPFKDLVVAGMAMGKVKVGAGLTWLQVDGAGHMVPINNPAAASFAVATLLPNASDHVARVQVPIRCPESREDGRGLLDAHPLGSLQRLYVQQSFPLVDGQAAELAVALALGCACAAAFALARTGGPQKGTHGHSFRSLILVTPPEKVCTRESEVSITMQQEEHLLVASSSEASSSD